VSTLLRLDVDPNTYIASPSDWDSPRSPSHDAVPLICSARSGHIATVRVLCADRRLDVSLTCVCGMTALGYACQNGHLEVVRFLCSIPQVAANVNFRANDIDDGYHSTALWHACAAGHTDVVKFLLSNPNVDVNLPGKDNMTPLAVAVIEGFDRVVRTLCADPRTEINARDVTHYNYTALHHACSWGREAITRTCVPPKA